MPARRLCRALLRIQAKPSLGGLAPVHEKHMPHTAAVAAQPLGTQAELGARLADATPGFAALGLDERVLGTMSDLDLLTPTPVQAAAIPALLSGKNAAIQSYTGSGKTLAYLLPTLSRAIQYAEAEFEALQKEGQAYKAGALQALVVAPSRELAMQIVRVAQELLPPPAKNTVQQCIGGANPHRQAEALKNHKPIMVVGTPGRLAELSLAGKLLMHPTGVLVLDEVDQLLQPHFAEDMARLTVHCGKRAPRGRQTVMVSATLTAKMLQQTQHWCPNPERIFVKSDGSAATADELDAAAARMQSNAEAGPSGEAAAPQEAPPDLPPHLEHLYIDTTRRHRVDAVRRCIHALDLQRVLVFMNYQQRLKDTQFKLGAHNMAVGCLHGEMRKGERQRELAKFRRGEYRALLVSDVAARGLDVPECDGVIHLELPSGPESYAHRAGRTGRAGRAGVVISIAEPDNFWIIDKMQKRLNVKICKADVKAGELVRSA